MRKYLFYFLLFLSNVCVGQNTRVFSFHQVFISDGYYYKNQDTPEFLTYKGILEQFNLLNPENSTRNAVYAERIICMVPNVKLEVKPTYTMDELVPFYKLVCNVIRDDMYNLHIKKVEAIRYEKIFAAKDYMVLVLYYSPKR